MRSLFDFSTDANGKTIATCPLFWDCECDGEDYIHPVTEDECPFCNARRGEQPDSRVNEVMYHTDKLPPGLVGIMESMLEDFGKEPIPF